MTVDAEERSLITIFPLPFRVLALIGVGILGWATNLHGLRISNIDAVSAMELRVEGSTSSADRNTAVRSLYSTMYRMFFTYVALCFLSWYLFRTVTYGNVILVDVFGYIPGVTALLVALALVCPFNILFRQERNKFLRTVRRCLLSPMDSPVYFADVVFADIFTSFAKVLGDVWLSIDMFLPGNTLLQTSSDRGWQLWVLPTIMSLPYIVRFRQCIIEYSSSRNDSRKPLFNALKYATSFPVIYLSVAQKIVASDLVQEMGESVTEHAWHGEHTLFRLWLLAAAVNSLYSFWWDITNDWGLELLKPTSAAPRPNQLRRLVLPHLHTTSPLLAIHTSRHSLESHPVPHNVSQPIQHIFGLRPILLYPLPMYPLLIFVNLVLRLTWSIKLSSHLHSKSDGSIAIFCLEVAEIFRRWMWVFIRVEWEIIKRAQEGAAQPRLDDDSDDEDYELVASNAVS